MTMRAVAFLSGMLAWQRARCSVPPSLTISLARFRTYSSAPIGTPTTVTRSFSATRASPLSRSEIFFAVGAWPFGGGATVLEVFDHDADLFHSRRRKSKALIVLDVIPIKPGETSPIDATASTPPVSNSSLKRFSPARKSKTEDREAHAVSLLDTAGARDRSAFCRVHPKEHVRWPCTVALGHKRRERWHKTCYLRKHRGPFHSPKGVGAVSDNEQIPVSCSVRAFCPTCSTPQGTATPKCLTSRLTSSDRGFHCFIAPAVISFLHVMATQTDRHFYPSGVRLACRKSYQNSGRNAFGSSTSLLRKAVMPWSNSSIPMLVWVMDGR